MAKENINIKQYLGHVDLNVITEDLVNDAVLIWLRKSEKKEENTNELLWNMVRVWHYTGNTFTKR